MRIFKDKSFSRFARKKRISDETLRSVVADLEQGHWDAHLGGNVYKQRIARPGEGTSGGYRTILFFQKGNRTFFVYGFAKSERSNIDDVELAFYKEYARDLFGLTDTQIQTRIEQHTLIEITDRNHGGA